MGTVSPSPRLPDSFASGRYQVKRFLGEGGKKRVYLAHDTMLARDVAFALIKADGLDAEGRERITREAQAMGRLGTHPHIVAVFDIGVEPTDPDTRWGALHAPGGAGQGGTPYLVTELMAGGDIEALLERHRGAPAPSPVVGGPGLLAGEPVLRPGLPIADAINLALQITRVLYFAGGKLLSWGRREQAEALWSELEGLAAHTRDSYLLLRPPFLDAIRATLDGRLEEALEAISRLESQAEELGSPAFGQTWAPILAFRPMVYLGRVEENITGLPRSDFQPGLKDPLTVLALCYGGRFNEARAMLPRVQQQVLGEVMGEGRTRLLEAAVLLQDRESVEGRMPLLRGWEGTLGQPERAITCTARHMGAAYALLGDNESARGYYRQATG